MQQAASRDEEFVALVLAGNDPQGDIRLQLLHESIAQLPAGDIGPLLAREGRIVDAKKHVKRRFVDLDRRQRDGVFDIRDRVADIDVFQSDHGAKVASQDLVGFGPA